jgi:hypothetical protein
MRTWASVSSTKHLTFLNYSDPIKSTVQLDTERVCWCEHCHNKNDRLEYGTGSRLLARWWCYMA